MEHYYQNIGHDWFDYPDLYRSIALEYDNNSVIVEVGSWLGRSISFLAVEFINLNKFPKIHSVDIWDDSGKHIKPYTDVEDGDYIFYRAYLKNIEPVNNIVNPIRLPSIKASELFEDNSIDFCFIDANHEYEFVLDDIRAWYPKVKQGGIIAGHDYAGEGVKLAIKDSKVIEKHRHVSVNCWLSVKK